jgi:prolyl-tRNA synthetase
MKDLYTFDYSPSLALDTYHEVREMYTKLFDELKIPYLVADADSGNMGGNLSHEFHFPTPKGEDHIISCNNCDYVANEELAEAAVVLDDTRSQDIFVYHYQGRKPHLWRGISHDRATLINVWYYPASESTAVMLDTPEVNVHAVKAVVPDLDASIEDPLSLWKLHASQPSTSFSASKSSPSLILDLLHFETAFPTAVSIEHPGESPQLPDIEGWNNDISTEFMVKNKVRRRSIRKDPKTTQPLNLLRIKDGDSCSRCTDGKLKVQKAIELGHTFHLGTRYSEPLEANVMVPRNLVEDHTQIAVDKSESDNTSRLVPMQMGCHGIGVSRLIGAVADTLADAKGLNWPRVMAPYEVVVIPAKGNEEAALEVYDSLAFTENEAPLDLILDDRGETLPWKMGDADLIGYPVIVILGKKWKKEGVCEVQCRRLGIRQDCLVGELPTFVRSLLEQL